MLGAALVLQITNGFVKGEVFWLALLALPGTLIGARIGARVYQALSDRNFYDMVLGPAVSLRARIGLEQHRPRR